MGGCHIPYPYSLFSRTKREDFVGVMREARALLDRAPGSRFRRELLIWAEYMARFKTLFDDYHAGKLSEKDLDDFLAWIASHRDTRIFVQSKFGTYFKALRECLRSGRPWLHFNLDWEDEYIRRQEKTIY